MKPKALLSLLISGLLSMAPLVAAEDNLPGEMLMTGAWHGDEVSAKSGESWLALFNTEQGAVLQQVEIVVEMVVDEILDTPPAATGKKVSVSDDSDPIVILRGLKQLNPGPVTHAEITDRNFSAGEPTGVYFNGMTYELEIACEESPSEEKIADCPLVLTGAGKSQALTTYPVFRPGKPDQSIASEAFPQVIWAGDLDGDRQLDLIIDLTDHYNVAEPTLLLSNEAGESNLVRPAAVFRTTGC